MNMPLVSFPFSILLGQFVFPVDTRICSVYAGKEPSNLLVRSISRSSGVARQAQDGVGHRSTIGGPRFEVGTADGIGIAFLPPQLWSARDLRDCRDTCLYGLHASRPVRLIAEIEIFILSVY
jgi:hypothetical protein